MAIKPAEFYSKMAKIYDDFVMLTWIKYLTSISTEEFFEIIISNYNLWKAGIHIAGRYYDEIYDPFVVKVLWQFFRTLEFELNYRNLVMTEYIETLHQNIKDISEILAEIDIRHNYMKNIGIPELHNLLKAFYPKVASFYLKRIKEDMKEILEYVTPKGGENYEQQEQSDAIAGN